MAGVCGKRGIAPTRIHDRVEQAVFTVLTVAGVGEDGISAIADRIAGLATSVALAEIISALGRVGAVGAVLALEDAAYDDIRKSHSSCMKGDRDEMWNAVAIARSEMEAAEDSEPPFDPADLGC